MTSSNDDIIKAILQYQERLDRYNQNKNEDKMLYVIGKLSKLQIRTLHLETTGIGRTVNALKKLGGSVGDAAKDLVTSWKFMVLEEEKAAQETSLEDDADSVYSSENENKDCQKQDSSKENISHSENESEGYGSKPEIRRNSKNEVESNLCKYNKGDSRSKSSSSSSSSSESSLSSAESEKEAYSKRKEHHSRKRIHSYNSSSDDRETHHSKKFKNDSDRSSQDNHKNKSSKESRGDKHEKSDNKHREISEKHKKNSDKCKESSYRSESKHKSKKDTESESKHKSDKKYDEGKHKKDSETVKSSHNTKKHEEKENSRHKSDKHKNEKTDKHTKSSHSSKDKESRHSSSSSKRDSKIEKKSSEIKLKDSIKEDKTKDIYKSKDSHTSSSSKHKSSNSEDPAKKKVKLDKISNATKKEIVHGIDSGSGASFAEALGMCGPMAPNSKKKSDKPKITQNPTRSLENVETESTKNRKSKNDDSGSSSSKIVVPELLKEEPIEPLNVCLSSLLPEITPNYKPLGISLDTQPKRLYTDDEALSRVMTNKNQRTKVYSGNKTVGKVESLFQLCVRVLQDNIDALEYTGGVPYIILKPIMERATADQIFNLEHHNPYLIEDTDELWQLHCQKDFRNKQREEMESWRDMYMRCLDEREAKLNAVKANIKLSQDKSIPVRTTKLAYIDSEFVKPPRNVAKRQAKNGTINTDRKITTTQKLTALAQSGEAGKVSVPDPGRKAADRGGSSGAVSSATVMKAKKAPLMAKTLSFMKNRFRR
ncbi:transcription elongation factor B polypeptide 3 [Diorhabda carinulata]|uniref:transcription elongation factor B polypeptide 3 n=1 Tax=Diorhabda carinulata TaxID=1163345 RepID=UPI0025A14D89|nr:transcription elongation factor B polypeptide 3 [Diorhabda carinulata]